MATRKKSARQSLAFSTPQTESQRSTHSRRSLSTLSLEDDDSDANEILFSTLMNDPLKKAVLRQFLSYNKDGCKDILELVKRKAKQEFQPSKRTPHLSPMALCRKRALAAMREEKISGDRVSQKIYSRAAVPFNKLLQGVIAYVEIISQNQDRSAGVKALLKAMGAKVSENIHRAITHAIIKDVSYDTYRKANMVKAHLVSVLWLEAVRKNHCRVPEKHYPAMGPEAYGSNISLLCEELQKDYADVVKDELERSRSLQRTIRCNLSSRFSEDLINTSRDCDMNSVISGINRIEQKSDIQESVDDNLQSENAPPETSSDSESEMGLVNGQIMQKQEDSNLIESPKRLRYFFESSSGNASLHKKVSNASATDKTPTLSVNKENITDDIDHQKSPPKRGRKSKSLERNKESQVLDILSELQISNNRRISRNRSRTSSASSKENVGDGSYNLLVSSDSREEMVDISEEVTPLRISADGSKGRTTESSALSSLRISTESNKSKQAGASESIPSLRISSTSCERRTTESTALSSLRISTDSKKSKDDSLECNLSNGASELSSNFKDSVSETPDKQIKRNNPYVNITQRKKKRTNQQICLDNSVEKSSSEVAKKTTSKTANKSPEITKKNVEIAPVLMTPSAKRLIPEKLPNVLDTDNEHSDITEANETPCPPKKPISQLVDCQFKTPAKLVKVKKRIQRETKVQVTPLRRSTRRNSSILVAEVAVSTQKNNRRSTLEFLPKEDLRTPSKNKNTPRKPRKATSIVCSRYHNNEVQVFTQIVHKLGTFFIEDEVTDKTSHLVLGEPKRTVNVLRALARGCWIMRSQWLYKSLEEGKWLPEEDYEMTEYLPAVQKSRQERQAFGHSYSMDIFSNCGKIYVAKSSSPRCSDLQELVTICKGHVTTIQRNAAVVVGEYIKGDFTCVSVNWLLDSISSYKRASLKKYLLEPPRRNSEDC